MFEGKPPRSHDSAPAALPAAPETLRPLDWSELVGRLALARDARASHLAGEAPFEGSFDAGSARRISAQYDGRQAVNLEDSANRKVAGRKAPTAPFAERGAARE